MLIRLRCYTKSLNIFYPLTRFAGALPKGEPFKSLPPWGRWHAVGMTERADKDQTFHWEFVLFPHSAYRLVRLHRMHHAHQDVGGQQGGAAAGEEGEGDAHHREDGQAHTHVL